MTYRMECPQCDSWQQPGWCSRISMGLPCTYAKPGDSVWVSTEQMQENAAKMPKFHGGKATAIDPQVGGGHYKDMKIQPVEFIHANGIGYFEGCVIKYVSRWRKKNGVEDLKKARHFLDLLIEFEEGARHG